MSSNINWIMISIDTLLIFSRADLKPKKEVKIDSFCFCLNCSPSQEEEENTKNFNESFYISKGRKFHLIFKAIVGR